MKLKESYRLMTNCSVDIKYDIFMIVCSSNRICVSTFIFGCLPVLQSVARVLLASEYKRSRRDTDSFGTRLYVACRTWVRAAVDTKFQSLTE